MTKAYKYSVVYFLAFSLLLLLSGAFLFENKIGFSIESVNEYYLGNSETYIPEKSSSGILKITLPHFFCLWALLYGYFTLLGFYEAWRFLQS